jgi:hypothetical protein
MTTSEKSSPVRALALRCNSANRVSIPATSLAGSVNFESFSPAPGDSEVISHFD